MKHPFIVRELTPTLFSTSPVTIQLATNAVVSRLFSAQLTNIAVVRRLAGKKAYISKRDRNGGQQRGGKYGVGIARE